MLGSQMIPVKLTQVEELMAGAFGFERTMKAKLNGFEDRSFQKLNFADKIARDVEACGAEIAVAKYLGLDDFKPDNEAFKNFADIGFNIEVKWTKWKEGSLILDDRQRENDVAILVTGNMPNLYVCGWTPVSMARRPSRRRSDGCYWIGQADLFPMSDFLRSKYGNAQA